MDCIVTSPPYFRVKSYLRNADPGKLREIGQESTVEDYVETMVRVFAELHHVLRRRGTVWLNIWDCYAGEEVKGAGLKTRDLAMIPAKVVIALRARGWYLRSKVA